MKKFLPEAKNGFTLVELLVVVSIIAILAVIGLAIFSGVQKNARDAKRRGDIDAISKAWEAHYSNTTPRYGALQTSWFSSNTIPSDPISGWNYTGTAASANTYCICATVEGGSIGNSPNTSCGSGGGIYYCRVNQQ